jgi:hypothetical protein
MRNAMFKMIQDSTTGALGHFWAWVLCEHSYTHVKLRCLCWAQAKSGLPLARLQATRKYWWSSPAMMRAWTKSVQMGVKFYHPKITLHFAIQRYHWILFISIILLITTELHGIEDAQWVSFMG